MQTSITTVQTLFGEAQFVIPAYQREYQWDADRWFGLWYDLGILYTNAADGKATLPAHFVGAMIIQAGSAIPGQPITYEVIDGQQRLVTLSVLLAAIRDARAESRGEYLSENHKLGWVRDDDGEVVGTRIRAQKADEESLGRAMNDDWRSWYVHATSATAQRTHRVLQAYSFFRFLIWLGEGSFVEREDIPTLPVPKKGQSGATVTEIWDASKAATDYGVPREIDLDRLDLTVRQHLKLLILTIETDDEDGPRIFDTMNAKRTELEQWDFVRNSLFVRLASDARDQVFAKHWGPIQEVLRQSVYSNLRANSRDAFVYDYLIARGESKVQGPINRARGHAQLMTRFRRLTSASGGSTAEAFMVKDFLPAARAWVIATGNEHRLKLDSHQEVTSELALTRDTILRLSAGPPIPAVLHYMDLWLHGSLDVPGLVTRLRLVESYVARHVLAQTPLSPFRARFMEIMSAIANSNELKPLKDELLTDWISDAALRDALGQKPAYGALMPQQLGAVFQRLEAQLAGPGANPLVFGRGSPDMYTVEHVYPRGFENGPNEPWRVEFDQLGVGVQDISWLTTHRDHIGNLTVLTNEANNKLKQKPFAVKRAALGGDTTVAKIPPLTISKDIVAAGRWSRAEVEARASHLADLAIQCWPTPASP